MYLTKKDITDPVNVVVGKKRQYFPYVLNMDCPECNESVSIDFTKKYISCPLFGKDEEVELCCPMCDHEYSVHVMPEIILKIV